MIVHKVYVIHATDGKDGTRVTKIPAGDSPGKIRQMESICACEKLGIEGVLRKFSFQFHAGDKRRVRFKFTTFAKSCLMNKNGPVIIIEDDADDQEILTEVFQKLSYPNKIMFFFDGQEALNFINKTDILPFLILSDINMPKLDGFELRKKLKTDAELQVKCIPYLFFSTALNQKSVIDAYSMSVQGFFVKQSSISELEKTISVIMEYWKRCAAPNDF